MQEEVREKTRNLIAALDKLLQSTDPRINEDIDLNEFYIIGQQIILTTKDLVTLMNELIQYERNIRRRPSSIPPGGLHISNPKNSVQGRHTNRDNVENFTIAQTPAARKPERLSKEEVFVRAATIIHRGNQPCLDCLAYGYPGVGPCIHNRKI